MAQIINFDQETLIHTLELVFPMCLYGEAMHLQCLQV